MKKIIYLDAAASFLKPKSVIDTECDFLKNKYANSGRGVCARAGLVDELIFNARKSVGQFINATENQIVFTSGATDGLNRIVQIIRKKYKNKKLRIAVSDIEHHSARMPWEYIAYDGDAEIILCPLTDNMDYNIEQIPMVDVFVITAMSNVVGIAQNVEKIIQIAKKKNPNVITIVDACQYVVHFNIDVVRFDCDFLVFSGHKIGADTGVGVMYIKNPNDFYPDKFGGGMIARLNTGVKNWVFETEIHKFEAGTLPLTQIIGLPVAIDELKKNRPDTNLIKYAYGRLNEIKGIKIITSYDSSLLCFVVGGMHILDFGTLVGANNICLRVGNMCASWIHNRLKLDGSARISVGPWNTKLDIDDFVKVVKNVVE